jgi:hypothetical protein
MLRRACNGGLTESVGAAPAHRKDESRIALRSGDGRDANTSAKDFPAVQLYRVPRHDLAAQRV